MTKIHNERGAGRKPLNKSGSKKQKTVSLSIEAIEKVESKMMENEIKSFSECVEILILSN
jgi:hypothetical protein